MTIAKTAMNLVLQGADDCKARSNASPHWPRRPT
jgi:hypothetical protein